MSHLGRILKRTWERGGQIDVFFLGGAVAFSVTLAAVPFLLLLLGLVGFLLPHIDDPSDAVLAFLMAEVPQSDGLLDPTSFVGGLLESLVRDRAGISLVGIFLFVWFSTRLVGSLRVVLRQVFDVQDGRGIVAGKAFDGLVVLAGTLLVTVNLAVTLFVIALGSEGVRRLGITGDVLSSFEAVLVRATGFVAIWVLSLLVYKLITERKISWKTAVLAATFMALAHEALKLAFSWYVTSVATYRSVYGSLATVAVTFFWIYYTATAFVVGGLVAEAITLENER